MMHLCIYNNASLSFNDSNSIASTDPLSSSNVKEFASDDAV